MKKAMITMSWNFRSLAEEYGLSDQAVLRLITNVQPLSIEGVGPLLSAWLGEGDVIYLTFETQYPLNALATGIVDTTEVTETEERYFYKAKALVNETLRPYGACVSEWNKRGTHSNRIIKPLEIHGFNYSYESRQTEVLFAGRSKHFMENLKWDKVVDKPITGKDSLNIDINLSKQLWIKPEGVVGSVLGHRADGETHYLLVRLVDPIIVNTDAPTSEIRFANQPEAEYVLGWSGLTTSRMENGEKIDMPVETLCFYLQPEDDFKPL